MSTVGYIGINNNKSKKIKSLYIGINNLSKKVNKAYIGVNNKSKLWYKSGYPDPPNDQYESKSLGTWSSLSQVNTFLNTYNAENGYSGLKLGNYVTIQDGTYNVQWEIAGFNMEYNQTAADNTVYNNGYGICMIPKTYVRTAKWNDDTSGKGLKNGYIGTSMHTYVLPTISTNLKNILGTHLINRNVLLSRSVDSAYHSNNYTWTTTYATCMSAGQLTGTFASHSNKYDDGEANYKLPLFNYENYLINSTDEYWLRGIYGLSYGYDEAWAVYKSITYIDIWSPYGTARPLIYIR